MSDMPVLTPEDCRMPVSNDCREAFAEAKRRGIVGVVDDDGWTRYKLATGRFLYVAYSGCFISKKREG